MEAVRWIRGVVPLAAIALLGTTGLARPPVLGAGDPPWDPPPCRGAAASVPVQAAVAWYRMDPVLDATGTLAGRRLTLGVVGGRARHIDLAPESFASGPVRGRVLVGDDDGTRSRLRIVDVVRGCASTLAREADVIRSALLAPDLASTWEHRVGRATRADAGIWQRSTAGSGAARRRLPGLAPDDRYGPTFVTDLRWTGDGRLSIASCGELACRTRVLDPATGRMIVALGTGPVLGLADRAVVAYAICPGLPCAIVSIDPATGARSTLVDAAGLATLGGRTGPVLVFQQPDGALVALDLRTYARRSAPDGAGMHPVAAGSIAEFGAEGRAGQVVVVASGGNADGPEDAGLLDPDTAAILPLSEVRR